MRHTTRRTLAGLLALALAGCGDGATAPGDAVPVGGGIITFAFGAQPGTTMRVAAGASAVEAAEAYIATQAGPRMPFGPIVRGAGVADDRYPFHFIADSVKLVEIAIELCDGAPMTTPDEVDAFMRESTGLAFPSSARWCPWSAYPIAVERSDADAGTGTVSGS